ncbi:MAG TPA: DUF1595 domain-containing protein, partial [Polyangiaceae bacterium]|nr:DUF1595 domain-containing protein [Polyangiaceae bacterium]
MSSRILPLALLAALGVAVYGCQGNIEGTARPGGSVAGSGDPNNPNNPNNGSAGSVASPVTGGQPPEQVLTSTACAKPAPGTAPLRRLSNSEYRNTLQDLLASVSGIGPAVDTSTKNFVDEAESLGFKNNADFLGVSSLVAQGYMDSAESLAPLVASTQPLVGCSTQDAACAKQFVETFGKRAFRRPLAPDEVARYTGEYDKAAAKGYDFKTGIEWIVFAMLQSTEFLYRVELGAPKGSDYTPSAYETATRLSYLIWQSMPD